MAAPPIKKTMDGLLEDTRIRLALVERRLGAGSNIPNRLGPDLNSIGAGVDLNTITETGWYIQNLSANATLALHYPWTRAGHLQVSAGLFSTGADFIMQVYTEYNANAGVSAPVNRQWRRTMYNGTWDPWMVVGDVRADQIGVKMCSGTFIVAASVAAGGASGGNVVTFPAGFFSAVPLSIFAMPGNGRLTPSISALTAASVTINMNNWSPAATPVNQTVWWTAIGVGP